MAFLAALPSIPCFLARSFSGTRDSQPAIKLGKPEYILIATLTQKVRGEFKCVFRLYGWLWEKF